MVTQKEKEITSLRSKLAALEAELQREEQVRTLLEQAQAQLLSTLKNSDLTLESYVQFYFKDIRKLVTKIEQAQKKTAGVQTVKRKVRKKVTKRTRRSAKPKITIKIPAGQYSNIPPDLEHVFVVKEKGPRPKVLKAYAEEVGLEAFLTQCLME